MGKFRASLTGLYCNSATASQGMCSPCCEADPTKCGGATYTCAANKYKDPAKAGTAIGNNAATTCCISKMTCASYTALQCAAGWMPKNNSGTMNYCATATCGSADTMANCCKPDPSKCGGANPTCPSGQMVNPSTAGTATGTNAATTCCIAKATCAAFQSQTTTTSGGRQTQSMVGGLSFATAVWMTLCK